MIEPSQIPDEVAWKLHDKLWKVGGPSVDEVRASIAAALNAWLRALLKIDGRYFLLPLPQENSNAEG